MIGSAVVLGTIAVGWQILEPFEEVFRRLQTLERLVHRVAHHHLVGARHHSHALEQCFERGGCGLDAQRGHYDLVGDICTHARSLSSVAKAPWRAPMAHYPMSTLRA